MPRLFGTKLRGLRHRYELTQTALAKQLSLASHAHIANLEASEDTPSLALVVRIAQTFGITTDYLLRDDLPVDAEVVAPASAPETRELSPSFFGMQLRALRLKHGLTQAELARRLGLARQGYISNLEAGRKNPSLELVVQVADAFGVTTDDLFWGDVSNSNLELEEQ